MIKLMLLRKLRKIVDIESQISEDDSSTSFFSKCLDKLKGSHFYKLQYRNRELNIVCPPYSYSKKKSKYI